MRKLFETSSLYLIFSSFIFSSHLMTRISTCL